MLRGHMLESLPNLLREIEHERGLNRVGRCGGRVELQQTLACLGKQLGIVVDALVIAGRTARLVLDPRIQLNEGGIRDLQSHVSRTVGRNVDRVTVERPLRQGRITGMLSLGRAHWRLCSCRLAAHRVTQTAARQPAAIRMVERGRWRKTSHRTEDAWG